MHNDDKVQEILANLFMLEEGIVPMFKKEPPNVKSILESMDPEDARKAKRKFRKLWRKYLRQNKLGWRHGEKPLNHTITRRKKLVTRMILIEKVEPVIENLRNR